MLGCGEGPAGSLLHTTNADSMGVPPCPTLPSESDEHEVDVIFFLKEQTAKPKTVVTEETLNQHLLVLYAHFQGPH